MFSLRSSKCETIELHDLIRVSHAVDLCCALLVPSQTSLLTHQVFKPHNSDHYIFELISYVEWIAVIILIIFSTYDSTMASMMANSM